MFRHTHLWGSVGMNGRWKSYCRSAGSIRLPPLGFAHKMPADFKNAVLTRIQDADFPKSRVARFGQSPNADFPKKCRTQTSMRDGGFVPGFQKVSLGQSKSEGVLSTNPMGPDLAYAQTPISDRNVEPKISTFEGGWTWSLKHHFP